MPGPLMLLSFSVRCRVYSFLGTRGNVYFYISFSSRQLLISIISLFVVSTSLALLQRFFTDFLETDITMIALVKRAFTATNSAQLAIVIVPIIMVALATCTVVLRFHARRLTKADVLIDDWLVLAALVDLSRINDTGLRLTDQLILDSDLDFQGVNMGAVFAGGLGLPIAQVMAVNAQLFVTFMQIC